MDGGNKDSRPVIDAQGVEPATKFTDTFVAVGYASKALRPPDLLLKNTGNLNCDRLRFSATGARENGAVLLGFLRLPLTFILAKFFGSFDVCSRAHSNFPFR